MDERKDGSLLFCCCQKDLSTHHDKLNAEADLLVPSFPVAARTFSLAADKLEHRLTGESTGPSCVTYKDTHPRVAGCPTRRTPGSWLPLRELNSDGADKPERSFQTTIASNSACFSL